MAYLRTVFALIACKRRAFAGVDCCSWTSTSTFDKLREIERIALCIPVVALLPQVIRPGPDSVPPSWFILQPIVPPAQTVAPTCRHGDGGCQRGGNVGDRHPVSEEENNPGTSDQPGTDVGRTLPRQASGVPQASDGS